MSYNQDINPFTQLFLDISAAILFSTPATDDPGMDIPEGSHFSPDIGSVASITEVADRSTQTVVTEVLRPGLQKTTTVMIAEDILSPSPNISPNVPIEKTKNSVHNTPFETATSCNTETLSEVTYAESIASSSLVTFQNIRQKVTEFYTKYSASRDEQNSIILSRGGSALDSGAALLEDGDDTKEDPSINHSEIDSERLYKPKSSKNNAIKSIDDLRAVTSPSTARKSKSRKYMKATLDLGMEFSSGIGPCCLYLKNILRLLPTEKYNQEKDQISDSILQIETFNSLATHCNQLYRDSSIYVYPNSIGLFTRSKVQQNKITRVLTKAIEYPPLRASTFGRRLSTYFNANTNKTAVLALIASLNEIKPAIVDRSHAYVGIFVKINNVYKYYLYDVAPEEKVFRDAPTAFIDILAELSLHGILRRAYGNQGNGEKNCFTRALRYIAIAMDSSKKFKNFLNKQKFKRDNISVNKRFKIKR